MTTAFAASVVVVLLTVATVCATVALHYGGLGWLAGRPTGRLGPRRRRVLYTVIGVLLLHAVEIGIFGCAFWAGLLMPGAGELVGAGYPGLLDAIYLSATTFSTVGFGDVVPTGAIRVIAAAESVLGLFLIGWSATFTYREMERNWR